MSEAGIFTEEFALRLDLARQQKVSKLRGRCMEGSHVGKLASPINYFAAYQSYRPGTLYGPKPITPNSYNRRWCSPQDFGLSPLFDNWEQLRTTLDPKAQAPGSIAAAFNRDIDDVLIGAAFAAATVSTTDGLSTSSEAWSTTASDSGGYIVAENFNNGSTSIGLTVEKMIEVIRVFTHNHVEDEMMTMVTGSQQIANAMGLVQIISTEFNTRPTLTEGANGFRNMLGMQIVGSERLLSNNGLNNHGSSNNVRRCLAFVQSGLYLGVWEDQILKVHQRTDLIGDPWEFSARHTHGATRLEPGRLLEVQCGSDSAGFDITP